MNRSSKLRTLVALATAATLAACGGSGGNDTAAATTAPAARTSDLPASATQSTGGLIAYMLRELVASSSDTSEPIRVGDATLPANDDAEPSAVD